MPRLADCAVTSFGGHPAVDEQYLLVDGDTHTEEEKEDGGDCA
jgi:hypothetical protein